MKHQDFEKYALEKSMEGNIASIRVDYFEKNILSLVDCPMEEVKVLDYGFGDGKYYDLFCRYFNKDNIFGAEVSKLRVARAKKRGFENTFFVQNKEILPFKSNYFDFINVDQVLEHIREEDRDFYIKELRRVMKKNGSMFIVVPNYPIKRIYDLYYAMKYHDIKRVKDVPTHICFYNFHKLKTFLEKYFISIVLSATGGLLYKKIRINYFSHKIFCIVSGKS